MNELSLIQAVDRFSQRIVVAVAPAADRQFDVCFGQSLAVEKVDVLITPVEVIDQRSVTARLASVQRLLECIQNNFRGHRRTDTPVDDASGEPSCRESRRANLVASSAARPCNAPLRYRPGSSLLPDFLRAVDLHVAQSDTIDLRPQRRITLRARTKPRRIAKL